MSGKNKLMLEGLTPGDLLQLRCYDTTTFVAPDGHLSGNIYDVLSGAPSGGQFIPLVYLGPHDDILSTTAVRLLSAKHGVCWRYICGAMELAQPVTACEKGSQ